MNDLSSFGEDQSARAEARTGFPDAHPRSARAAGATSAEGAIAATSQQRATPSQHSHPGRSPWARRRNELWAKTLNALLACAPVGTYAVMAEQAVRAEQLVVTAPAVPEPRQATSLS